MDVLVTTVHKRTDKDDDSSRSLTSVYIIWGGATYMNCSDEEKPVISMIGQPLAIDYNGDMIIDLFGQDEDGKRSFWIFDKSRQNPKLIRMEDRNRIHNKLSQPHAHAYLGKICFVNLTYLPRPVE